MKRLKRVWKLIPAWKMPSDPVKAVGWFLHWLLRLAVNFFWLPILVLIVFETSVNWRLEGPFDGIISGVVTLVVGAIVWAVLFGILTLVNLTSGVKQVLSDAVRMQQTLNGRSSYNPFMNFDSAEQEEHIVEGSITDLDEERRKRR
jgi:hypothetical protein